MDVCQALHVAVVHVTETQNYADQDFSNSFQSAFFQAVYIELMHDTIFFKYSPFLHK